MITKQEILNYAELLKTVKIPYFDGLHRTLSLPESAFINLSNKKKLSRQEFPLSVLFNNTKYNAFQQNIVETLYYFKMDDGPFVFDEAEISKLFDLYEKVSFITPKQLENNIVDLMSKINVSFSEIGYESNLYIRFSKFINIFDIYYSKSTIFDESKKVIKRITSFHHLIIHFSKVLNEMINIYLSCDDFLTRGKWCLENTNNQEMFEFFEEEISKAEEKLLRLKTNIGTLIYISQGRICKGKTNINVDSSLESVSKVIEDCKSSKASCGPLLTSEQNDMIDQILIIIKLSC